MQASRIELTRQYLLAMPLKAPAITPAFIIEIAPHLCRQALNIVDIPKAQLQEILVTLSSQTASMRAEERDLFLMDRVTEWAQSANSRLIQQQLLTIIAERSTPSMPLDSLTAFVTTHEDIAEQLSRESIDIRKVSKDKIINMLQTLLSANVVDTSIESLRAAITTWAKSDSVPEEARAAAPSDFHAKRTAPGIIEFVRDNRYPSTTWITEADINKVFEGMTDKVRQGLLISTPINLESLDAKLRGISKYLRDQNITSTTEVYIPINLAGGHWVTGYFKFSPVASASAAGATHAISHARLIDSTTTKTESAERFVAAVRSITPEAKIHTVSRKIQTDNGHSCGDYTCREILGALSTAHSLAEITSEAVSPALLAALQKIAAITGTANLSADATALRQQITDIIAQNIEHKRVMGPKVSSTPLVIAINALPIKIVIRENAHQAHTFDIDMPHDLSGISFKGSFRNYLVNLAQSWNSGAVAKAESICGLLARPASTSLELIRAQLSQHRTSLWGATTSLALFDAAKRRAIPIPQKPAQAIAFGADARATEGSCLPHL